MKKNQNSPAAPSTQSNGISSGSELDAKSGDGAPEKYSQIETIKCLSLQQPFADEVFFWGKWCENRAWNTSHRGELWIHASKLAYPPSPDEIDGSPTGLLTGHILGSVNLVACVPADILFSVANADALKILGRRPADQPAFDESNTEAVFLKKLLADVDPDSWEHFGFSEFAWIFGEPDMLDQPIPAKGKLRIWELEVATDKLVLADENQTTWK